MYKIMLLTIISTILLSQDFFALHPKPYSALGDVIYDNVNKIEKLKNINGFEFYKGDIEKYVSKVQKTKDDGYQLEKNQARISKREYLNRLRTLSKKNDFYLRTIKNTYLSSMETNNYEQFSQIINSELIDVNSSKGVIIDYYYEHEEDINASGVIENFLNEDARLKALKDTQRKKYKSKKTLQEEKIQRMRKNDKEAKIKLENRLQNDLVKKKLEIRKNQKKELSF